MGGRVCPPTCCVHSLPIPQGGFPGPGDPTVDKPAACHPEPPLVSCQTGGPAPPHPTGFWIPGGELSPPPLQLLGSLRPSRTAHDSPYSPFGPAGPSSPQLSWPHPDAWKMRGGGQAEPRPCPLPAVSSTPYPPIFFIFASGFLVFSNKKEVITCNWAAGVWEVLG